MQLDKNMAYHLGRAIILSSILVCASCCAGANRKGENRPAWDHNDDAEYFINQPERGSVAYSVLLVAAQATVGIEKYGSVADKISAESRGCSSWIVFQGIDAGNSQIDGTLLCRKGDGRWQGRKFGYTGAETYYRPLIYGFDQETTNEIALAVSEPRIDFKNYTVLDDTALFITKYEGDIVRSAVYAPTEFADESRNASSSTLWTFSKIYEFIEALDSEGKRQK